jgi:hypothetical protein
MSTANRAFSYSVRRVFTLNCVFTFLKTPGNDALLLENTPSRLHLDEILRYLGLHHGQLNRFTSAYKMKTAVKAG